MTQLPVEELQFGWDLIGQTEAVVDSEILKKYPDAHADIGDTEDGDGNRFKVKINIYKLPDGKEIFTGFRAGKLWRIAFVGAFPHKLFITDTYEFGQKEVKIENVGGHAIA